MRMKDKTIRGYIGLKPIFRSTKESKKNGVLQINRGHGQKGKDRKRSYFENVDGHDIILGYGDGIVDPMASAKAIAGLLMESDEAKAIATLNLQIDAGYQKLINRSLPVKVSLTIYAVKFNGWRINYRSLSAELDERRSQLIVEHAQYCQPGRNEQLCSLEQFEKYQSLQGPNIKVKVDGTAIADFRGTVYYSLSGKKWTETTITILGDTIPKRRYLRR